MHAQIVTAQRAPSKSLFSEGALLRKKNKTTYGEQEDLDSIRIIHVYALYSKRYYAALLEEEGVHPDYAYGVKGRRREECIAAHQITNQRLRLAGLDQALKMYDVKDAHPSSKHEGIDKVVDQHTRTALDAKCMKQLYKEPITTLEGTDGVIMLCANSGVPQGSTNASRILKPAH